MEHPDSRRDRNEPPLLAQASVLYAIASEYWRMAALADTNMVVLAINNLAKGYTALAKQRETEERTEMSGASRLSAPDLPVVRSSKQHQVAQRVLVVDDTVDVLVAVGAFLLGEGFAVVSAADGDTALRLIASDPQISVLITDYAMPGLSGVELIAQAVQIRPDLKALLITGYPNADGLEELPSQIKMLTKPFRRAALITHVNTLLSESLARQPDEAMEPVESREV